MPLLIVLIVLVGLCAAIFIAAVAYRFLGIRGTGTPIVFWVSTQPEVSRPWRHGVARYTEDSAIIYKLISVRLQGDVRLRRASMELGSGRSPESTAEREVLDSSEQIVPFTARDFRDREVYGEIGMDTRTHAALRSWVEACSTGAVPRRKRHRG